MKTCSRCGRLQPLASFHASPTAKDGRHSMCRSCARAYRRERQARLRAVLAAGTDVVPRNKRCPKCKEVLPSGEFGPNRSHEDGLNTYCQVCVRVAYPAVSPERRRQVLAHYGGRCRCCGERTFEFLALYDEQGTAAASARRSFSASGASLIAWLIEQGLPRGFRVLCHNCNLARAVHGSCPHERDGVDRTGGRTVVTVEA